MVSRLFWALSALNVWSSCSWLSSLPCSPLTAFIVSASCCDSCAGSIAIGLSIRACRWIEVRLRARIHRAFLFFLLTGFLLWGLLGGQGFFDSFAQLWPRKALRYFVTLSSQEEHASSTPAFRRRDSAMQQLLKLPRPLPGPLDRSAYRPKSDRSWFPWNRFEDHPWSVGSPPAPFALLLPVDPLWLGRGFGLNQPYRPLPGLRLGLNLCLGLGVCQPQSPLGRCR